MTATMRISPVVENEVVRLRKSGIADPQGDAAAESPTPRPALWKPCCGSLVPSRAEPRTGVQRRASWHPGVAPPSLFGRLPMGRKLGFRREPGDEVEKRAVVQR